MSRVKPSSCRISLTASESLYESPKGVKKSVKNRQEGTRYDEKKDESRQQVKKKEGMRHKELRQDEKRRYKMRRDENILD